ncbi:MAG: hypothetical protein ACREJG_08100 [Candidatus Rokuibacteriota bacterium]
MAQPASEIAKELAIAWLNNNELKLEIPTTAGQVIAQVYRDIVKAVQEAQAQGH